MLRFCQNMRPGFLAHNTPTLRILESLGRLDLVILMCTKGTGSTHTDWTSELRFFANIELQLPHHRGGYRITPCAGSATSAFYASTASLCGGWVITAMLIRISSTSQFFWRQSRTCPFQIPGKRKRKAAPVRANLPQC